MAPVAAHRLPPGRRGGWVWGVAGSRLRPAASPLPPAGTSGRCRRPSLLARRPAGSPRPTRHVSRLVPAPLPAEVAPAQWPPRPRASPVLYRRPRFLRGSGSSSGTADARAAWTPGPCAARYGAARCPGTQATPSECLAPNGPARTSPPRESYPEAASPTP